MNETDRARSAWTVRLKLKGRELGRWALGDRPLTIGRDGENDVVIDNLSVSREHAVLEPIEGGIRVRDLGSLNGLAVNGQDVESAALGHGDVVTIGKHRLEIRFEPAGGADSLEPTIERERDAIGPGIENPGRLVELTDTGERPYVLDQAVVILGSGESADIRVTGRFIAPYHAEILYGDGSYLLRHVEGRRKVKVDGKAVVERVLEDGSEISLGDRTFLFFGARVGAGSR